MCSRKCIKNITINLDHLGDLLKICYVHSAQESRYNNFLRLDIFFCYDYLMKIVNFYVLHYPFEGRKYLRNLLYI